MADDPWLGTTLDARYRITELIGRGGMAAVYRARDTQLDRLVAVKIFAPGAASDDARRRGEVQVLARLSHPNLVTLFDAHLAPEGSETPSYLSMELVDGPDLRRMMDRAVLPGAVAGRVIGDIAEALVCVHGSGVVHRDLKPANILLERTGLPSPEYRAKLADFGIAHLVGGERLTTTGLIIGTAAYLSPEQASGLEPGAAADIYTLGLIILECLTGLPAFPGTVSEAIGARLAQGPDIPASVPQPWVSLIRSMTESDPAARPTAVEVAVTARQIEPELDDWMPPPMAAGHADGAVGTEAGQHADATDNATAPMPEPTRILPRPADLPVEPTLVSPALTGVVSESELGTSERTELLPPAPRTDDRPRTARFMRPGAVIGAGILVVLAAVIALALVLQPGNMPHSAPTPSGSTTQSHSTTPSTTPTTAISSAPSPAPQPAPSGHGHGKGKPKKGK